MRISADRLNDNTMDAATSSGLVAATDFTVGSFSGRKVNGITTVEVFCTYTGAGITQTGTNITDTLMATLPAGWRPPETINASFGNGSAVGECTIGTGGLVTLRCVTANISTSSPNFRVTQSWISENG
ncbi:hypothetical protein ACWCQN_13315 [Streptomyces sp. NPDC001984]